MSTRRGDLLVAVALTEFSVHYEQADPELSRRAWQLAADCLLKHDVEPADFDRALATLVSRDGGPLATDEIAP